MGVWRGVPELKINEKRRGPLSHRSRAMVVNWFRSKYPDNPVNPFTAKWEITHPKQIERRDPDNFGRAEFISVGHSVQVYIYNTNRFCDYIYYFFIIHQYIHAHSAIHACMCTYRFNMAKRVAPQNQRELPSSMVTSISRTWFRSNLPSMGLSGYLSFRSGTRLKLRKKQDREWTYRNAMTSRALFSSGRSILTPHPK
jgi:hypothetical protein